MGVASWELLGRELPIGPSCSSRMHSGYKNLPQLPCAFLGCHPNATMCVRGLPHYRVRSWVAIHMLPCAFLGCLQPATTQPATPPIIHMLPCAFVGCLQPATTQPATSPIIHMLPCAFVGCLQPCPPGHQPNRPPTQPAPATIPSPLCHPHATVRIRGLPPPCPGLGPCGIG